MPLLLDPFDKIAEDLQATFRPQREWINKRGLVLIVAHFLSGVAAGTWLFSLIFDSSAGLLVGFLIALAGAIAHLLFLGKPQRLWRMIKRPGSSWISRGMISLSVFLPFALLYILPGYLPGLPWSTKSSFGQFAMVLSLIGMGGIFVYKGFVYAASRGIPFWNTPLLPPLYIAYGLRGGVAVLFIILPFATPNVLSESTRIIEFWIALSTGILLLFYLGVMKGANITTIESTKQLISGRVSLAFYLGAVSLGLIVPLIIGALGYFKTIPASWLVAGAAASLIGDFYVKYCVAKAGVYQPVFSHFPIRAT